MRHAGIPSGFNVLTCRVKSKAIALSEILVLLYFIPIIIPKSFKLAIFNYYTRTAACVWQWYYEPGFLHANHRVFVG
jgi:hypothetical protein